MEKASEKTQSTLQQTSSKIFSFLDFPSLMNSLAVSQDFNQHINNYFKRELKTNNMINDLEGDEDHYRKLYRSLFAREVLVSPFSEVKTSYKDLKFNRYPGYSTYGVRDFSMGLVFTVFHLYNDDLVFMKNEEYLNSRVDLDKIDLKNVRKNVAKFSTASNDLFYMTTSGQLHIIFNNAEARSGELAEGTLEASINTPLVEFSLSYPRAVLVSREIVHCLDLTNLVLTDLNSPARLQQIQGLDDQTVSSFCVGASYAYFLANEGQVLECNFNVLQQGKFTALPYQHLKNKTIRKLWCGKGHFFALEQSQTPSIDNWTRQDILDWVQRKEFVEFANIIKSEGITGKDLLRADRAFLVDRLGMEKQDVQTKFLNDINKHSKVTYGNHRLFGWGNNVHGQLGLNISTNNVNVPTEIKTLPEFTKDDAIEHIECRTKVTAIVTQKGGLYITEVQHKRENREKAAATWRNLAPTCFASKHTKEDKVIKVSITQDHFAVLVAKTELSKANDKKQEDTQESTSIKLKGADHICNRLLWDKSLNKDEYVVGYEDRFLGILEIPFNEFCSKTDIPTHRIKFFKQNEEMIWDRATKMNKIGF